MLSRTFPEAVDVHDLPRDAATFDLRLGQADLREIGELSRADPEGGQVWFSGRQVRRGRSKDVATVEDVRDRFEDDILRSDGDGAPGTAVRAPCQRQHAVVRADQLATGFGFDGDRQPISPHPRVDDREAHGVSRCKPETLWNSWMRPPARTSTPGNAMGEVHDG